MLPSLAFVLSTISVLSSAQSDTSNVFIYPNFLFGSVYNDGDIATSYTATLAQSDCLRNNNGELVVQNYGGADCSDCTITGTNETAMIYCDCGDGGGGYPRASVAFDSVFTTVASTLYACGTVTATATPQYTYTSSFASTTPTP